MLVLVVDSSTPAVTAALAELTGTAVAIRAERRTVDARAHGELLAPGIDAVLAEAGVRPADLAAIVAGTGPGPFTGLRVGLVTAATMGQVLGIPTYGVCSLDALGRAAAGAGPVLVASDARRREVYWAVYDGAGGRLAGPEVGPAEDAVARARDLGVDAAVGEGAHRYAERIDLPLRAEPRFPPALALAELAAPRAAAGAATEPLTPLYLRRPDAVAATARKPVLP
ncbi:tRNA (adenosine(37)-N6)-threonylcarbamoyltransferase complex dimerization subunit type 1 TsaB [Plantactinospora sp. KBS50]|uniref:tRNA (adenosine(37)-N6)-threonylcarbamoyltransferase complex dimerization subunit type 1 TsaB n=1 Tax=Plantactinospora sp. KBS50 TaxID=2024580 RepID=UPI000BAAA798|nr:tRNA (adenosine(37)-N6)-threonylcarbamoyltransferase complex dimerization subunit type 1 TsaB [Plantactinospora sp. KBS50]ASW53600.1 tRNA (adenosine(37)-N6)-threonylcarbamoyltransferase complex dimerization subunit type 1 TsaB [Plantactinospora sp. KBS50]